jgi:hypothetical protein
MTDCRLLILIFAFVFIACNSRSERVDSSDNAGQSIINTSIVKLTIDTISSSDFKSRFPQAEVVSQLEGFTIFDRTDSTYFPNDATVSVIEISAVKKARTYLLMVIASRLRHVLNGFGSMRQISSTIRRHHYRIQ